MKAIHIRPHNSELWAIVDLINELYLCLLSNEAHIVRIYKLITHDLNELV